MKFGVQKGIAQMKVLHINCNYMTTELHQTMIEHLEMRGVENCIFAPIYDVKKAVIMPNDNVVVSECFKKWDRIWFDYKQHKIYKALRDAINIEEFDCIHAYTVFTDGNCAWKLSKRYGKPFVVAVRDTDVNAFFKFMPHLRRRGVNIMRHASRVLFLSTTYRDFVIDKYIPRKYRDEILQKSIIVPNGIDNIWFENPCTDRDLVDAVQRFNKKCVKIVFVGRINSNKNPLTTLRAMDILESMGYRTEFTVAGSFFDDSIKNVLLSDKRVHYVGKLNKFELIEIYRNSDIFVMPSHNETFGLVYAEAMSQGLPVLYTRGQGFDGQFPDGEIGYSIDPNSPADIANRIICVMQNYESLSTNCSLRYRKFNWNQIADEYQTIYSEII